MSITFKRAIEVASEYVQLMEQEMELPLCLLPNPLDRSRIWVFAYGVDWSRAGHLNEDDFRIGGGGPVIVVKDSGEVIGCSSAYGTEECAERYEAGLDVF